MSGTHKYPTISFRISPREREEIEAKIFTSGMKKKDYFVRSCIYNRVCVVGKKEQFIRLWNGCRKWRIGWWNWRSKLMAKIRGLLPKKSEICGKPMKIC